MSAAQSRRKSEVTDSPSTPPALHIVQGGDARGSLSKQVARGVRRVTIWLYLVAGVFIITTTWTTKRALDSKIQTLETFIASSSAEQVANYDVDGLDKSARFSLLDSDIRYIGFIDAKGKVLAEAGTKNGFHATSVRDIIRGETQLGQVEVQYSNITAIISCCAYLFICVVGLFFFQRLVRRQFESILDAVIQPTRSVVAKLEHASARILERSAALADTSQILALEVANQSSATTESMSAMTEMGEMVQRTADYSRTSVDNVVEVGKKTEHGELVVRKMSTSMASIEEATAELKEIYGIVTGIAAKASLINEIVFQTKLLSFNASVEAARAGEHGRGFSVVAEEIGHLAVMSGSAAREINDLLGKSREHVDRIVASTTARISDVRSVSTDTIRVFEEIAREVRDVSAHIQQIDQAAREQDAGVRNSQEAMHKIEQISRKSNEIAEEVRSSAGGLSTQSHGINDVIAELKSLI